jgi:hypothetical protein
MVLNTLNLCFSNVHVLSKMKAQAHIIKLNQIMPQCEYYGTMFLVIFALFKSQK